MTEKQKAVELVESFRGYVRDLKQSGYELLYSEHKETKNAKECAKIVVDGIIKELDSTVFNYDMDFHYKTMSPSKTTIPYYERVKEEIEKL